MSYWVQLYNVGKINIGPVEPRNIDMAATFGTLTTLPAIALTYLAFRFLQAGVSVSFWHNKHQKTLVGLAYGLNVFWCLLQLAIQATAQLYMARFLTDRYIEKTCTAANGCYNWPNVAQACQTYFSYTVMVAILVLVLALYLIRRQEVLKKSPNNYLLTTVALIVLAQIVAAITAQTLSAKNKKSHFLTLQTEFVMDLVIIINYLLANALICLVLLKILHIEYK